MLWHRLQIDMSIAINDDFGNLLVKLVDWSFQSLLELLCHKLVSACPFLESFGNQVVCETLVFVILHLHLIVICVEHYRHLYSLNIWIIYLVLANRELFHAKVVSEGLGDLVSADLADVAVEEVQFDHAVVL